MNNKIININKRGFSADFSWLPDIEKIFSSSFKKDFKKSRSISIALVGAEEIKQLNQVYRRKNKITDVLSFNMDSDQILGEVIICLEQAKAQAKVKQKTLKSELQLLTIHGILHLLGYDHERGEKYAAQQELAQEKILNLLN
jgi:probable rRNA maturation factor